MKQDVKNKSLGRPSVDSLRAEAAAELFVSESRERGLELSQGGVDDSVEGGVDHAHAPWTEAGLSSPLRCPWTLAACHAECAAFVPEGSTKLDAGTAPDMEARRSLPVRGRCELVGVAIELREEA